jgi:hypothetical protein
MVSGKEVVMEPCRPRRLAALAAFAVSAALAFSIVRPGAPEAGDGDAPPLAVAGPVRLYGELARAGEGWSVQVRAVNGGRSAQRCRVTARVAERRDSPMSRVVSVPQELWTTELALKVRAGAAAEQRAVVPAAVADRLGTAARALPTPARNAAALEQVTRSVSLQAACVDEEAVG